MLSLKRVHTWVVMWQSEGTKKNKTDGKNVSERERAERKTNIKLASRSLPLPLPNLISWFLFANAVLSNVKKSLRLAKNFASDAWSICNRALFTSKDYHSKHLLQSERNQKSNEAGKLVIRAKAEFKSGLNLEINLDGLASQTVKFEFVKSLTSIWINSFKRGKIEKSSKHIKKLWKTQI